MNHMREAGSMGYLSLMKKLSLREKVGQMFMIGFQGRSLPREVRAFINEANIGFVSLFWRNVESPAQVVELTNEIHASAKIPPMIFTDQEGGVVCQFGEMASTFTSPMGLSATGEPLMAETAGAGIGRDMALLGIDGVIAPVVDVNRKPSNPIIGVRAFSDEPETVVRFSRPFLRGLRGAGPAPVLKHFPGHGGTSADSHLALPVVEEDLDFLREVDLRPFASLSQEVDFVMSAHVVFPAVDPSGLPATFSRRILGEVLRTELGFEGVVFTDCLEMAAIRENFSPEATVKLAVEAGADVLVVSHSLELQRELYAILLNMVKEGEIPEERINLSVSRILRAKEKYGVLNSKERAPRQAEENLRALRAVEDEVCAASIALLRNEVRAIPISQNERVGIVEWDKVPSTVPISEARRKSYLDARAGEYFEGAEVLLLPLEEPDFSAVKEFVASHDALILAPYSRTPEAERLQGEVISEILKMKEDAVVSSLANPYDIRRFPRAKTYLAAFSFRDCSIKALFDVLAGRRRAVGRLPVEVKDIFPRWHRWQGK